jgi:hypothetical protein
MAFGDDAIIRHTKNWFQGCVQVHITKNWCFWCGSLESLPNKNYLTEDSKNWSAPVPDSYKQIEKNRSLLWLSGTMQLLCPTNRCTSEDECKWSFTAIWFILLKKTVDDETPNSGYTSTVTIYRQNAVVYNITYSVHDGSLMLRRTRLPVILAAPWESRLLHCCWSTAYLGPH